MIKITTVENHDNTLYNTPGGDDTKDKVFLLSQLEMIESGYGFADSYDEEDVSRRCAPSNYAKARGAGVWYNKDYKTIDGLLACNWWLRSPGRFASRAAYVGIIGSVGSDGYDVPGYYYDIEGYYSINLAVRPALVLSLKS